MTWRRMLGVTQVVTSNKVLERESVKAKPGKAWKGAKNQNFSFLQDYLNQDLIIVIFKDYFIVGVTLF